MNCLFQSLFHEFLELLKTKNLIESRFSRHHDGTWFVDFQYLLRQLDIFGKAEDLRQLPSFSAFFQLIADEGEISLESAIKTNIYLIFGFQFSEYFNYIYSSGAKPINFSNTHADISSVTDKAFLNAYLHKTQPVQENVYLIFFDNLEIENDFVVNSELSFYKISNSRIYKK